MVHKGQYLQNYVNDMTRVVSKINPEWDEDMIRETVEAMVDESLVNPTVELDNNYTAQHSEATLLSVLDWVLDKEPIIAGNATFYKNQHVAINPVARMLEGFLSKRKMFKNKMFEVDDYTSRAYKTFDLNQGNMKVLTNSYYGGSGMPSSAFYSTWSGAATTYSAQSVISTAEQMFESLLADNYLYINLTELIEWCEKVLYEFDFDQFDDFIVRRDAQDVLDRCLPKIIDVKKADEDIFLNYLLSHNEEELTVLYYANNMEDFIKDHQEVRDVIFSVLWNIENLDYVDENLSEEEWICEIPKKYREEFMGGSPKDWNKFVNKEYFMDPNNPPDGVVTEINVLNDYISRYVYVRYLSFDRIYRLRNFKRGVVTVIDTDSNILSLDTLVQIILDEIVKNETFGRSAEHNEFIIINMIAFVLTSVVTDILLYYGEESYIPEEFRPIFSMKNEFYFSLLFIGHKRKRYISKILLREGNLMNPPKSDIKGLTKVKTHHIARYDCITWLIAGKPITKGNQQRSIV